jgi:hypothetical protein
MNVIIEKAKGMGIADFGLGNERIRKLENWRIG